MPAPPSPVPPEVALELDRIVRRWHQLPVDRVEAPSPGTGRTYAERVRALVQRLADAVARQTSTPNAPTSQPRGHQPTSEPRTPQLTPQARTHQHEPRDFAANLGTFPQTSGLPARDLPRSGRESLGSRRGLVPDLGPETVMDQLRVLVYDACAQAAVPASVLRDELVRLRRELP